MKLYSGIVELKPGWNVRLPYPMTMMEMSRFRFGPLGGLVGEAGGILEAVGPMMGPLMGMMGSKAEGDESMEIAEARAKIDLENARRVRERSVENAKILAEKRDRLVALQTVNVAASNVRTNVGAQLGIRAKTIADITKDIGFILETGREDVRFLKYSAALEIAGGKKKKQKSSFDAITQGLSIANMGLGLFPGLGGGFGGISGMLSGTSMMSGIFGGSSGNFPSSAFSNPVPIS